MPRSEESRRAETSYSPTVFSSRTGRPNAAVFSIALLFFASLFLSPAPPLRAEEVSDGLPFLFERERDQLERLWKKLDTEPDPADQTTGFIALSRQSRAYRGRQVRIEGRLLRIGETAFPAEKEDGLSLITCYESWVLLDDERQIPVRLVTREIPEGLTPTPPDDETLRRERIAADGIYYRLASYDAGDDFYSSPVIVAESFTLQTPISRPEEAESAPPFRYGKLIALAALLALWILVRLAVRKTTRPAGRGRTRRETARVDHDFRFDESQIETLKTAADDAPPPLFPAPDASPGQTQPGGKPGKVAPLLLCALLWTGELRAVSEEFTPTINRTFWEEVTPIDTETLLAATSEEAPPFRESLRIMLDRLQKSISPALLARDIQAAATENDAAHSAPTDDYPNNFGVPLAFEGKVTAIDRQTLDDRADLPPLEIYRVRLETDGTPLEIRTPEIPKGWGDDGAKGIGQIGSGLGIFFGKFDAPIIAAARIGWQSAPTPLGRLGFDISLFDHVAAHAIGELSALPPGKERQAMLRNFRLTPDDRFPFYGLLSASAQAGAFPLPPTEPLTVIDLFNRPAESQGRLVTLTGRLRRAQRVLVSDGEILALYGIDHYYELYLFTADSQDYPVLFCTPELPVAPDGRPVPVGSGENYRQEVTLTGFLYKPWAYRIDTANSPLAPGFLDSDREEGKRWIAVPLMIGLRGSWNPDVSLSEENASPFSRGVGYLFGAFVFLVVFYLTFRRRRSKPLRFTVGRDPENP